MHTVKDLQYILYTVYLFSIRLDHQRRAPEMQSIVLDASIMEVNYVDSIVESTDQSVTGTHAHSLTRPSHFRVQS